MTETPLDPLLHNLTRIAIVGRLVFHRDLRLVRLRDLVGLTRGNLATHLVALERAGYVSQRDAIIGLRPGKVVTLTEAGRAAFHAYVASLEALVQRLHAIPAAPAANSPPPTILP